MRQGYAGSWLFRLPYSVEEQEGIVFFTLYLALGHLARLTGLSLVFVFHAARIRQRFSTVKGNRLNWCKSARLPINVHTPT